MDETPAPRIQRLQERIEYLEEVNRQTTDALRLAATLGTFETSMSRLDTNEAILRETCLRANRLLPCSAAGIFLFDEDTADLELAFCDPEDAAGRMRRELESLVESRTLAWALDRNAPYIASSTNRGESLLLHSLATTSRIRGVFLGLLEPNSHDVPDSMRLLFSIVMQSSANSLESFALYHLLRDMNAALEDKVRRLAASEQAVTRSRDWLQTIFDVIPVGVNIVNSNYEIVEISDKLLQFFKVQNRRDLKGRHCYRVLKGRTAPCPECSMPGVFASSRLCERFSSDEEDAITGRSFKIFSVPLRNEEQGLYSVAEFHLDISDLRALESALVNARDEAQRANRAKSDFLASMSHEIRTPMNAIIGMTELALTSEPTEEQREYLETILDSSGHLLMLINDILDFSKIEARKLELERIDFDLHETMHTVMRSMRTPVEAAGLELQLHIAPDTPRCLRGDPGRLRQVLLNLLGNAAKFTHKGLIRCTVEPASAAMGAPRKDTHWLLFSVMDQGIGIPYEKQHEIFGEFYQAHSALNRRYGGTGLGLSITRLLVTLMGGRIWLESAPGHGSTFYVLLPLQTGDAGAVAACPETELDNDAQLPPLQVLLAEDNPVNARVATLYLERQGHSVVHARNGREALACLKQQLFDIVLMDLEMPDIDGLEATRRIRQGEAGNKAATVRIVAMTAHAVTGFRERCLQAGMDDFITKPVDFRSLDGALRPGAQARRPTAGACCSALPVLDRRQCLERIGGDVEIMEEVLLTYLEDMPRKVSLLHQLLEEGDMTRFRQVAHAIKGSAATIGALRCSDAAAALEHAATAEGVQELPGLLQRLETETTALERNLADEARSAGDTAPD